MLLSATISCEGPGEIFTLRHPRIAGSRKAGVGPPTGRGSGEVRVPDADPRVPKLPFPRPWVEAFQQKGLCLLRQNCTVPRQSSNATSAVGHLAAWLLDIQLCDSYTLSMLVLGSLHAQESDNEHSLCLEAPCTWRSVFSRLTRK